MIRALPCIKFSCKETKIAKKYGFITFPEFIDNFYVRYKTAQFNMFWKYLTQYYSQIKFAVYPDYRYDELLFLLGKFPNIRWIFPVHSKKEFEFAKRHFEWVGFPYRKSFRDYTLSEFLNYFKNHKKWYLGFWDESRPEVLLHFDGFDTTLPEYYSGKLGKIWVSWGKVYKPSLPMRTIEIFEINVRNFKKAIDELERQRTLEVIECV